METAIFKRMYRKELAETKEIMRNVNAAKKAELKAQAAAGDGGALHVESS